MTTVKISEIKPGMSHIDIVGKIISKEITPRSPDKPHATAVLQDDTGQIFGSLWREQIDQVNVSDIIKLRDAFVYLYKGNMELNTWKTIEIIKKDS